MSQMSPEMTRSTSLLVLLHFVGNALLLGLGYYWLGLGESSGTRLVWSFFVAAVFVCLAVWLHGATFAYFRATDSSHLTAAFRTALRNLVPLIVLGVLVLCLYVLLEWWRDYSPQPAFKIASYLTLKLRKPVKPATVLRSRGVLEETVAHELLHVLVESQAPPGSPVWFREGLTGYFEGSVQAPQAAATSVDDTDLRQKEDPTRARLAYAQAKRKVADLVNRYGEGAVLGWLKRGLPAELKNTASNQAPVKSR